MASITDPNTSVKFSSAMEEINNKLLKTYGEIIDTTTELSQSHRNFVKSALDICIKNCEDDEIIFEKIRTLKMDLEQKSTSLKEKQHAISKVMDEIQWKEMQKDDIIQKIQKLKDEQAKRKELIESQHKENKYKLKNLQKSRLIFQNNLGMEIRKILAKTQLDKGEKLQFVFRNIKPSDHNCAYVVTMGIKDDGSYQIVSSDPVLECLPALESQLQETNNLPAFLAKVRKEFISRARC
ncbi:hypothetical protein Q5P01_013502 [Channa striata]|uniref:Kinetochore protein SPC25 n=1 Tax=Channa striata TaxID=64152 RepID=A0AA88MJH7_CHASR|nr:hypothetical protein Q5P01_013502 [Channa striata]